MAVDWSKLALVQGTYQKSQTQAGIVEQAQFYALTSDSASFPVRGDTVSASGPFTSGYLVESAVRNDLVTAATIITIAAKKYLSGSPGAGFGPAYSTLSGDAKLTLTQSEYHVSPESMALRRPATGESADPSNIVRETGAGGAWIPDARNSSGDQMSAGDWKTFVPYECPFSGKPARAYLGKRQPQWHASIVQYTQTAPSSLPLAGVSSAANIPSTGDLSSLPNRTTAGFWRAVGRTTEPFTDPDGVAYWKITTELESVPIASSGSGIANEETGTAIIWDSTKNGGTFTWGTF